MLEGIEIDFFQSVLYSNVDFVVGSFTVKKDAKEKQHFFQYLSLYD